MNELNTKEEIRQELQKLRFKDKRNNIAFIIPVVLSIIAIIVTEVFGWRIMPDISFSESIEKLVVIHNGGTVSINYKVGDTSKEMETNDPAQVIVEWVMKERSELEKVENLKRVFNVLFHLIWLVIVLSFIYFLQEYNHRSLITRITGFFANMYDRGYQVIPYKEHQGNNLLFFHSEPYNGAIPPIPDENNNTYDKTIDVLYQAGTYELQDLIMSPKYMGYFFGRREQVSGKAGKSIRIIIVDDPVGSDKTCYSQDLIVYIHYCDYADYKTYIITEKLLKKAEELLKAKKILTNSDVTKYENAIKGSVALDLVVDNGDKYITIKARYFDSNNKTIKDMDVNDNIVRVIQVLLEGLAMNETEIGTSKPKVKYAKPDQLYESMVNINGNLSYYIDKLSTHLNG